MEATANFQNVIKQIGQKEPSKIALEDLEVMNIEVEDEEEFQNINEQTPEKENENAQPLC